MAWRQCRKACLVVSVGLTATLGASAGAYAQPATDYELSAAYCMGVYIQSREQTYQTLAQGKCDPATDDTCRAYNTAISRLGDYIVAKTVPISQPSLMLATQHGEDDVDTYTGLILACGKEHPLDPFDLTQKCANDRDTMGIKAREDHCGDVVKQLPF